METPKHRRQMNVLIDTLTSYLYGQGRRDFFVGGNMFVYYSQLQTKQNDFRGPDVFVVLGVPERRRKSWVVWEEGGKMPNVVIELLSESTEAIDRGRKMDIYAKIMRVGEYYLYDPDSCKLEGYQLDPAQGSYRPMTPADDGSLPCAQLGLRLAVRDATLGLNEEGPWLRWIDPRGEVLPHDSERAQAEAERARELAERLAAYERKFGKL
jgi:Uma2 family endonuclease